MLDEILADVTTQLTTINALASAISVGARYRHELSGMRRIVCVPTVDTFEQPTNPGGNPKPIFDHVIGATFYVWADDYYTTHTLARQLVTALHRAFKPRATSEATSRRAGSFVVAGGEWVDETEDLEHGKEYALTVTLRTPIVDRVYPSTPTPATDATALTHERVPSTTKMVADVAATLGDPSSAQGNVTINGPEVP